MFAAVHNVSLKDVKFSIPITIQFQINTYYKSAKNVTSKRVW